MALTTDDCDIIIDQIKEAIKKRPAGVISINDPNGGQMRFDSLTQLTEALSQWQTKRKELEFDENRGAAVLARRKPY